MKKLKKQHTSTIINPLFFTLFFIHHSLSINPYYESCVPKDSCKNGQNISYPFHIINDSNDPLICGYPGFGLSCNNGSSTSPTINISENTFIIKHINYTKHIFRLQNIATQSCVTKIKNMTLDPDRFTFVTTTKKLLISNCSGNLSSEYDKYKIQETSCDRNISTSHEYAMLENDVTNVIKDCDTVEMPVEMGGGEVVDGGNYGKVVERGFELRWLAADCGGCEKSGGRCGFNMTAFQFRCFCKDRPRRISCNPGKINSKVRITVIATMGVVIILVASVCVFMSLRKKIRIPPLHLKSIQDKTLDIGNVESLQYNFDTIKRATDNFSEENKLGRGGFGAVYKGKLEDGREIAVKRLAKDSGQGDIEFKNEVLLVAKLQHRNLVRLLGFSIRGIERLLIYEYLPNASLDHFIFVPAKNTFLDWEKRYNIINGIAKGLLYLHEDSRLRIIHRDMKASNILLDAEMNAKIADFGLARLFKPEETQGETSRIIGTYGYMAPEYAMYGQFSVKSDVFSFGVLVLEILTGQKNQCFRNGDSFENLLSFAWESWKNGTGLDILDPALKTGSSSLQSMIRSSLQSMMRCIHIGLLCVQGNDIDRPTMALVVMMLNNSSIALRIPSEPAFFTQTDEWPLLQEYSSAVIGSSIFEDPNKPRAMTSILGC